ncbi:NUDIX hydrolase [Metabacillus indicus]|uniref:NUDIX hydrolase n=1 Tax=Metabacillus indicus TaxID=246786 RepID=UPI003CE73629
MPAKFGEKINGIDYRIRKGVYAVIFSPKKDEVMTVRNRHGHYFLPGGGIEKDESHIQALEREMLEETGYEVFIHHYIGNAMKYFISTKNEPLLSDGYFYFANVTDKVQGAKERDHCLEWIDIKNMKQLLIHEHHYWAVNKELNKCI